MKLITVSGAHSGAGKTMVVEKLLKSLRGWSALKVTVLHKGNCPVGKNCVACDKIDSKFFIINDDSIIQEKGKDTSRYMKSGARKVFWLKAEPEGLKDGLKKAISKCRGSKGIVIEGTSILKHLNPDLAIFVKNKNSVLKPSAKDVIKKVDLILTL